jgi:hypothetical protein
MKRLVFLVEGNTEILFINKLVIPYLYELGFVNSMNAQAVITNRQQHKKGGITNYVLLKNDLERILAQPDVIVTTLIDFFKLPTNFPNYTTDSNRIDQIEIGIHTDFQNQFYLIPYIQRHELEALMFSSMDGFNIVVDDAEKLNQLDEIIKQYPNPEDINNSPETAPSKRLISIFGYEKTSDGELIFEAVGIEEIMNKCPRFNEWIQRIINKLRCN